MLYTRMKVLLDRCRYIYFKICIVISVVLYILRNKFLVTTYYLAYYCCGSENWCIYYICVTTSVV
jgi:hypothetical protein